MSEHTGIGLASLILGIIGLLCSISVFFYVFGGLLGAISLILGGLARFGKAKDGYGTAGMILGVIALILCALVEAVIYG